MTLLVHIAGNADLGLQGPAAACESTASKRLAELISCGDSESAKRLIVDLTFDAVASGNECRQVTSRSPVDKELDAISRYYAESWKSRGDDSVDILIVGVEEEDTNTATAELARALSRALKMALQSECFDGLRAKVLEPCILPGLQENKNYDSLDEKIGGYPGHVVLALGGGATGLLVTAAAVAVATHPDNWSLILLDRKPSSHGKEDEVRSPHIIDMPLDADPIRGWFLGLGLPTVLDGGINEAKYMNDKEVHHAAECIRRANGENPTDSTSLRDDLELLMVTDVARGDIGAGMAIGAWLREVKKVSASQFVPDRLRQFGNDARHDFASPKYGMDSAEVREFVQHEVDVEIPDWLSWPSPEVCFLCAQGKGGEGGVVSRPPLGVSLLTRTPPSTLRECCDVESPLRLNALVVHSDSSAKGASETISRLSGTVVAGANPSYTHDVWEFAGATPMNYGKSMSSASMDASAIEESMESLYCEAKTWLNERVRPRAIIVGIVGEKAALISLLRAAQVFGAEHGVPVFLMSSVRDQSTGKENLQFHQLGLDRDVRNALLEAALYCVDRLDLLTVRSLLHLGDLPMRDLADDAGDLAEELRRVVHSNDIDKEVSTILSVFASIADLLENTLSAEIQARLASIAVELLAVTPESIARQTGREPSVQPEILAMIEHKEIRHGLPLNQLSGGEILRVLYRIRNNLTIHHGSAGLADATRCLLNKYSFQDFDSVVFSDLLRLAVSAVRNEHHGIVPSDWGERLDSLRSSIQDLRNDAHV